MTKRGISSIVPSIYDPLGILQPYIIEGKMVLQNAWCYKAKNEQGLDWDDPLPPEIKNEFQSWLTKLKIASKLQLSRYLFHELIEPPKQEDLFLHVFSDAAIKAYGIVAYIRYYCISQKKFLSKVIYSCTRIALMKTKLSIPKMS